MRPRISLSQKIYNKKRELAFIIMNEKKCSLTRAFKIVEFNTQLRLIK
jgi:hypothetical protein